MQATGVQLRHLPTNGGGPALTAMLGNNSQVLVSSIAAANVPHAGRQGCGRSPASAPKRAPALPDVPTLKELGYNVEFYLWVGMFAPKGTPDAVIVTAARGRRGSAVADEKFVQAMKNLGEDGGLSRPARVPEPSGTRTRKRVEDAVRPIGKV